MALRKKWLIAILTFSMSSWSFADVLRIAPDSVEAPAWIIFDPQSHQIIAQSQADIPRAPASLTKMMVAYLTLQAVKQGKLSLDQQIIVPDVVKSVKGDESRLRLKPQEQITVGNLLSGLIIMSANDAALTLATVVGGDVPHFVALMNQTAKRLGMNNTHFSNPSGITMPDHYSTAHDLALLSQAIVRETPEYLQYSQQPEFTYHHWTHHATNILLKKDASVDGLKTGYTAAAGYNLALTANRLDMQTNTYRRLIVVVMGTANKYKRAEVAELLMNIAFNYTQTVTLNLPSQTIADIPVRYGTASLYRLQLPTLYNANTFSLLPAPYELDARQFHAEQQRFIYNEHILQPLKTPQHIQYQVKLVHPTLVAPIHETLSLADVEVRQFGQIVHQYRINQSINIDEARWWHRLWYWFKSLFSADTSHAKIYPIMEKTAQ